MGAARIRQDGSRVLLEIDGRAFSLPWEGALELGEALRQVARLAETYAKAESVVLDQALLTRTGAPFAIVPRGSKLMDAARTEAAHNRDLRRAIPSVTPTEGVGMPTVRQGPPPHRRTH